MATTVITLEVQATAVTGRASRIVVVSTAATGPAGAAGAGVVVGGTTGQVLKKASNSDYDTEWGTASVPVDDADNILATQVFG